MARIDRKLEQRLVNVEQLVASRTPDPAMPAPGPTPAEILEAKRALWQAAGLTPEERTAYREWWAVVEEVTKEPWTTVWRLFGRPGLTPEQRQAFLDYMRSMDMAALKDEDAEAPADPAALLEERDRQAIWEAVWAIREASLALNHRHGEAMVQLVESASLKVDAAWEGLLPEGRRYIKHWRGHDPYWLRFLGDEEAP